MRHTTLTAVALAVVILAGCSPEAGPASAQAQSVPAAASHIGDSVQTDLFLVTVNGVNESDQVEGTSAGAGNKFVILDVTIKNTDAEGRMFTPGELIAQYQGRELTFDDTETVLADGYLLLETLNPLTTVSGKIVYKVPAELTGPLAWQPGRDDKRISLASAVGVGKPEAQVAAATLVAAPAEAPESPVEAAPTDAEAVSGSVVISENIRGLIGETYGTARASLLENGFKPDTDGESYTTVANDPAQCGNRGCDVFWVNDDKQRLCVGVEYDERKEETNLEVLSLDPCT